MELFHPLVAYLVRSALREDLPQRAGSGLIP
jgi:hypothetical protein